MAKPQFTEDQCRAFADAANPHQWVLTADNLHEQAVALHGQRKVGGQLTFRRRREAARSWDNTNRATFLLCAFALENAIKAFLVYEHPGWVSGGHLHRDLCSHKLVALSAKATLIPYQKRDQWVLAAFGDGNESWMRYPCGRRADDVEAEKALPDALWAAYTRVMRGYGNRLIRLLGKGWSGPYGVGGSWEMVGNWLGGGAPVPANYKVPQIR